MPHSRVPARRLVGATPPSVRATGTQSRLAVGTSLTAIAPQSPDLPILGDIAMTLADDNGRKRLTHSDDSRSSDVAPEVTTPPREPEATPPALTGGVDRPTVEAMSVRGLR